MRRNLFICLLLAGVALAIYWPARHYGVVYFDDPLFVTDNEEINAGLTWHSLWWALSGVLVPPGQHSVELEYDDPWLRVGFLISLLAGFACLLLIAGPRLVGFVRRLLARKRAPTLG